MQTINTLKIHTTTILIITKRTNTHNQYIYIYIQIVTNNTKNTHNIYIYTKIY